MFSLSRDVLEGRLIQSEHEAQNVVHSTLDPLHIVSNNIETLFSQPLCDGPWYR